MSARRLKTGALIAKKDLPWTFSLKNVSRHLLTTALKPIRQSFALSVIPDSKDQTVGRHVLTNVLLMGVRHARQERPTFVLPVRSDTRKKKIQTIAEMMYSPTSVK